MYLSPWSSGFNDAYYGVVRTPDDLAKRSLEYRLGYTSFSQRKEDNRSSYFAEKYADRSSDDEDYYSGSSGGSRVSSAAAYKDATKGS